VDGAKYKKPTRIPAPEYIDNLFDWIEAQARGRGPPAAELCWGSARGLGCQRGRLAVHLCRAAPAAGTTTAAQRPYSTQPNPEPSWPRPPCKGPPRPAALQIDDDRVFPQQFGEPFPPHFSEVVS
jgi:hypothetical protein